MVWITALEWPPSIGAPAGWMLRPWVYRVYAGGADEMLLEMSPFRVRDNPYEDIAEGYYILNTNVSNNQQDHGRYDVAWQGSSLLRSVEV